MPLELSKITDEQRKLRADISKELRFEVDEREWVFAEEFFEKFPLQKLDHKTLLTAPYQAQCLQICQQKLGMTVQDAEDFLRNFDHSFYADEANNNIYAVKGKHHYAQESGKYREHPDLIPHGAFGKFRTVINREGNVMGMKVEGIENLNNLTKVAQKRNEAIHTVNATGQGRAMERSVDTPKPFLNKGQVTYKFITFQKYVRGMELKDWLEKTPSPSMEERIKVAMSCCNALASIQEKGLIHNDIKPENMMVDNNLNVHIIDYGFAVQLDKKNGQTSALLDRVYCTPLYVEPEYNRSRTCTYQSDIWSMALSIGKVVGLNSIAKGHLIDNHPFSGSYYGEICRFVNKFPTTELNMFNNVMSNLLSSNQQNRPTLASLHSALEQGLLQHQVEQCNTFEELITLLDTSNIQIIRSDNQPATHARIMLFLRKCLDDPEFLNKAMNINSPSDINPNTSYKNLYNITSACGLDKKVFGLMNEQRIKNNFNNELNRICEEYQQLIKDDANVNIMGFKIDISIRISKLTDQIQHLALGNKITSATESLLLENAQNIQNELSITLLKEKIDQLEKMDPRAPELFIHNLTILSRIYDDYKSSLSKIYSDKINVLKVDAIKFTEAEVKNTIKETIAKIKHATDTQTLETIRLESYQILDNLMPEYLDPKGDMYENYNIWLANQLEFLDEHLNQHSEVLNTFNDAKESVIKLLNHANNEIKVSKTKENIDKIKRALDARLADYRPDVVSKMASNGNLLKDYQQWYDNQLKNVAELITNNIKQAISECKDLSELDSVINKYQNAIKGSTDRISGQKMYSELRGLQKVIRDFDTNTFALLLKFSLKQFTNNYELREKVAYLSVTERLNFLSTSTVPQSKQEILQKEITTFKDLKSPLLTPIVDQWMQENMPNLGNQALKNAGNLQSSRQSFTPTLKKPPSIAQTRDKENPPAQTAKAKNIKNT